MTCSSPDARCARRSRRCSTTAAPTVFSWRCSPIVATASCRSAPITWARTCPPRAPSTCTCACGSSMASMRWRLPRPWRRAYEDRRGKRRCAGLDVGATSMRLEGGGVNHLLSVEDLDRGEIERIVELAARFAEISDREIKKVPALRGRMVLNLFYEASTRTRSSFELAAKQL